MTPFQLDDPVLSPWLKRAFRAQEWERLPANADRKSENWRIQLLKHRPGRRVCLLIEVPLIDSVSQADVNEVFSFILKVWSRKNRGAMIYQRLLELNELLDGLPKGGVQIPRPVFYDKKSHAMAYDYQEGVPLTTRLVEGISFEWIPPVARAIATLHSLPLENLPDRSAKDEISCIKTYLDKTEDAHLDNGATLLLLDRLSENLPSCAETRLLHRDLYDQQCLFTSEDSVYFIDLDDMARGDPMLDLGNLVAHLFLVKAWSGEPEALKQARGLLLERYANESGADHETLEERFYWYEAVALGRLAMLQRLRGNTVLVDPLLEAASRCVDTIQKESV